MSTSLIGKTLGHYRILDQLGAGGMGVVYRAQDMTLGRQVALKVLPGDHADESEAVERFRREARTASSLNHPNICTIYGFDEQDGQCYLAMELLDGEALDQRLAGRPLDLRTMLDLAVQVADALDAAHAEGILHRDIKPANIFITRRGQVKVLDFGLAKLTAERRLHSNEDVLETRVQRFSSVIGTTVGTIAYMSPEQARGEDLDPRTDLFSLGVVLYEMVTGRQSFPGHTTAVVFDGILNREPVPPSTLNHALPAELDRIISKALEKDRELRYQTAADLKSDLQRLRRDSGTRSVPVAGSSHGVAHQPSTRAAAPSAGVSGAGVPASPASAPAVPSGTIPPLDEGRNRLVPIGIAMVVMAAVGALLLAASWRASTPAQDTAPAQAESPSNPTPPLAVAPTTPDPAPPTNAPPVVAPASPPPAAVNTSVASAAAPTKGSAKGTTPTKGPAGTAPPAAPAPTASTDAAARERIEVARAKLASRLIDQGVSDLRQIVADFPGSPIAVEASFLAAASLEQAGRPDDAMGVYVEFERRFSSHPRAAESKARRAQLLQASKVQIRQTEAYALFGEIARDFPGTPEARTALQARRQVETQRRNLRATDPVLNIEVPALLVTLRAIGDQFPGEPTTMVALNQLAGGYEDLDRYQAAADVLERLGAQFPGNPMEVWFRLGELYERRLRDLEKARGAYERVPADSPRYREAQQRLKRR